MLAELLAEGWRVLGTLLSMPEPPMLTAETLDEEDSFHPVQPDYVCQAGGPVLYLGLGGHPEKVQLVLYMQSEGPYEVPEEEKGLQAGIVVVDEEGRWGGPLKLTLAAALSIALARLQDARIKDFKRNLSDRALSTPEELLQSLQVKEGSRGDLAESARQVFAALPLTVSDGRRLRILEIENEIDSLMVDLFVPIKLNGTVNPAVFERLYSLLDEAIRLLPSDETKRKSLAGIAFLVHEELLKESKRAPNPIPIVMESERLKERLKVLWPSPAA
jgi:hypothetical protein